MTDLENQHARLIISAEQQFQHSVFLINRYYTIAKKFEDLSINYGKIVCNDNIFTWFIDKSSNPLQDPSQSSSIKESFRLNNYTAKIELMIQETEIICSYYLYQKVEACYVRHEWVKILTYKFDDLDDIDRELRIFISKLEIEMEKRRHERHNVISYEFCSRIECLT